MRMPKCPSRVWRPNLVSKPQDAGPLRQARVLEPLALLWVSLAYVQGLGREFAFQIIKRAP